MSLRGSGRGRVALGFTETFGLYSLETGDLLASYPRDGRMAFDPSGRYVVMYEGGGIWILDVGSG